jgi:hypothetical protein
VGAGRTKPTQCRATFKISVISRGHFSKIHFPQDARMGVSLRPRQPPPPRPPHPRTPTKRKRIYLGGRGLLRGLRRAALDPHSGDISVSKFFE